jgi:predicted  nucleic acid-binding Zn-ribbon protein
MIQAVMLIALGFLIASLIGVLLAPALWNRARRLTRKRLELTLPLSLAEIEAAQDQIKASYAVRVRSLEKSLASAKQKAAMQLVDNSRLQMQIAALRETVSELELRLDERRNAATVLEQTITKRFPELDKEITSVKMQLQERSYDIQDLTNRLTRREEELVAAERAADGYRDELALLREAMEKSSADRSSRRLRRASQWGLEDYRAEYDRLNLELSKMRQQMASLQERESQHVGLIKSELTKLAELILISAQPKPEVRPVERVEPAAKRSSADMRRDRPAPWPQTATPLATPVPPPSPALAAEGAAPEELRPKPVSKVPEPAAGTVTSILKSLPAGAPSESGAVEGGLIGGRSRILQDVTDKPTPIAAGVPSQPGEINGAAAPASADAISAASKDGGKHPIDTSHSEQPPKEADKAPPATKVRQTLADMVAIAVGNGALHPQKEEPKPADAPPAGDHGAAGSSDKKPGDLQGRTLIDRLRSLSDEPAQADR